VDEMLSIAGAWLSVVSLPRHIEAGTFDASP
jgi:hypothetical protein